MSEKPSGRLAGKVAVVTGSASGIGEATVALFVAEGAQVVAVDRHADHGAAAAAAHGDAVRFVQADVTRLDQLKAAIDSAAEHFGGLDILFSNAGAGGTPATVQEFDAQGWDDTQALLLRSVVAGASYAVPHMVQRGGGAIVNTSSISALQSGYAPLSYSVAKAGVLHFTRVAAAELSALRIRINAVVPGFIATRIFGGVFGLDHAGAGALAERVATGSGGTNPIGRSGLPRDIAEAVLYLSSDAAGFVTGTHLTVDGGLTIGPRHSWDPKVDTPVTELLQIPRAQFEAMRAARRRGGGG